MKLTSFDVGQASWNLLDFGGGRLAIIDCGAGTAEDAARVAANVGARLRREPDTRIAFLLISHFDSDHVSGAQALLDDRVIAERIETIICNAADLRLLAGAIKRVGMAAAGSGAPSRTKRVARAAMSVLRVLKYIHERQTTSPDFHRDIVSPAPHDPAVYPVVLVSPATRGAKIAFLAPSQKLKNDSYWNLRAVGTAAETTLDDLLGIFNRPAWNTASIVVLIDEANRRVLVPGDATSNTWREALTRLGEADLTCDVVVAWHHGGRLGTLAGTDYDDAAWSRVLRTDKTTVVMSHDGDRRQYRHPHDRTLEALKAGSAEVFCTRLRFGRADQQLFDGEQAFPRKKYGHAIDFGVGGPATFRASDSLACCGDITVDISRHAVVTSCSNPAAAARRSNPACCQHR